VGYAVYGVGSDALVTRNGSCTSAAQRQESMDTISRLQDVLTVPERCFMGATG